MVENCCCFAEIEKTDTDVVDQVNKSNTFVVNLQDESNELVSNVSTANNGREIRRQENEHSDITNRIRFISIETKNAEEKYNEISSKWNIISRSNDCITIHDLCKIQQEKCLELINSKNNIINALKDELSLLDEQFENDLKIQQNDLDVLSSRMDKQIQLMGHAYATQLNLIQKSIGNERCAILQENQEIWKHIYHENDNNSQATLKEKSKIVRNHEEAVVSIISEYYENHRAERNELNRQLEVQRGKIEETKGTCLKNREKLNYSYYVLCKRNEESLYITCRHKKDIHRLKEKLTDANEKNDQLKRNIEFKKKSIKEGIKNLQNNIKNTKNKIHNCRSIIHKMFREIWNLNLSRSSHIVKKLLTIDEEIYNEMLKIKWKNPMIEHRSITDLPSYRIALKNNNSIKKNYVDEIENAVTRFVLTRINDNMTSVIDKKLQNLLKNLTKPIENIITLDILLQALDITSEEKLNKLVSYFTCHIKCSVCMNDSRICEKEPGISPRNMRVKMRSYSCESYKSLKHDRPLSASPYTLTKKEFGIRSIEEVCTYPSKHRLTILDCDVIEALLDYTKDQNQQRCVNGIDENMKFISRILSKNDIELYWNSIVESFPRERVIFWNVVHTACKKCCTLLQEENELSIAISKLTKENDELQTILRNIISFKESEKIPQIAL